MAIEVNLIPYNLIPEEIAFDNSLNSLQPLFDEMLNILEQLREGVGAGSTGTGVLAITEGGTGADNAADARTNLGLAVGVNVQGYSSNLDEADAFFGLTDITGTEAETLTDGSDAIGLHTHDKEIAARVALRI